MPFYFNTGIDFASFYDFPIHYIVYLNCSDNKFFCVLFFILSIKVRILRPITLSYNTGSILILCAISRFDI